MSLWRLIEDLPADGAYNMASDEALFLSCRENLVKGDQSLPVLRLYSWQSPEMSLGYNQKYEVFKDVSLNKVRRITGGKAVLHFPDQGELTYSVICPRDSDIFKVGIKQSYCILSKAFMLALSKIGVKGEFKSTNNESISSEACFVSSGAEEITVNGKKLIGSAQRRRSWGFIQQGAVIFSKNRELTDSVFGTGVSDSFSALDEFSKIIVSDFKKYLLESFSEVLGCEFQNDTYTELEEKTASWLKKNKYSSEDWTVNKKTQENYKDSDCLCSI